MVTKLETGRRASVSVAEMIALAAVLNCPPVMLMTADERGQADYQPGRVSLNYQVTPTVSADMGTVRAWIRGAGALSEHDDPREYYAELPVDEFYTVAGEMSAQQRFLRRPSSEHEGRDQDG